MIEEKGAAQRLLFESEAKFRTVFEVSPQILIILDRSWGLIEANREFARRTGLSLAEASGRPIWEIFLDKPEEAEKLKAEMGEKGQVLGLEVSREEEGGRSFYLFYGKMLKLESQDYILGVFADISARKAAETERAHLLDKLSRSRRLEAMGQMASEVAHELNNILSGVIGYPQLLLEQSQNLDQSQRAFLEDTMDAGRRAASAVADLMTMASGVATSKVRLDLNEIFARFLASDSWRQGLKDLPSPPTVTTDLPPGGIYAEGSPVHLKKIGKSLMERALLSAAQKGKGGEIRLSAFYAQLSEKPSGTAAGFDNLKPGGHSQRFAAFRVEDNGPPIPKEDREGIFEPFYLEKEGAGALGLATAANAAREHGGGMEVAFSPGGTAYTLYFPAASPVSKPLVGKNGQSLERYRGSGQKILVVDDVDIQRKLAQKMLTALGYEPISVPSGEEAVKYMMDNQADLIVMDMIMRPGINGRESYEAILAFKPRQKAIIASGMAENEEVAKALALGASGFIMKPYTLEDISLAVWKALNDGGAGYAAEEAAGKGRDGP
jgi:PAS domain S-box-containing protein